jgi:predicted Zn-dependent protease
MTHHIPPRCSRYPRLSCLLAAAFLGACATNPVTGKREFSLMSEAQEIQIGQELDVEVQREMGVYGDRAIQAYVSDIAQRMAGVSERPRLPWQFTVVDVPAVNAFALPGGYIYLTRGILPYLDDEAELAGVLGHEIGHVTARHAAQAYTRATGTGLGVAIASIFVPAARPFGSLAETAVGVLFLKYGRDDELEADRLGARYEFQTGWDPAGVPDLLNTLASRGDRRQAGHSELAGHASGARSARGRNPRNHRGAQGESVRVAGGRSRPIPPPDRRPRLRGQS